MSPRRPRVLHVVQRYFPEMGGLETHVAEVTRGLAATGEFDVTVLATDRSGALARHDVVNGVPVLRRRSWPKEGDLYLSPSSPVRTAGRGLQYRVLAPLLRRARRLIAVSRFERSAFAAVTGLAEDRFSVIPNGGALPPAPAVVAPVPGRIVTSGRLERYKGHHRVVEALPLVRESVPEAHLVVLGSGPYEAELRRTAERCGVAGQVEIRALPPADRSAMAGELARAAVMAAMSDYEAHPVGVMEAVTLGLPVVGGDVAGIGDLVEDGLVRGVAPGADARTLATALVEELVAGRSRGDVPHVPRAVQLPTWETSVAATAEVYHSVLRGGTA